MKRSVVLAVLGLSLALGFASAGRWQLGRAVEKEAQQAQAARVLAERRIQPLAVVSGEDSQALAWTQGEGVFADLPPLLLDNQRRDAAVGVRVFRVFLPTGGRALLVDLGWLPLPPDRRLPVVPRSPVTTVTLAGLMAPPPSAGLALGEASGEVRDQARLLTRIDLPALSALLGLPLAPRVLRLDPGLPLGHARDLDLLANTLPPEKHRGYALQWFGLAAATLVFTGLLLFRNRRRP